MRAYRTGHVDLCTNLRADVKDASFRAYDYFGLTEI